MAVETATPAGLADDLRQIPVAPVATTPIVHRVRVDGKHFVVGDERFRFRGLPQRTFKERADGALFPERAQVQSGLPAVAPAGFPVVRTYTPPPPDLLDTAGELGLRVLAGLSYEDWRYMIGDRRGAGRSVRREARAAASRLARSVAGNPAVLGICIGNEVPADVIRWVGTQPVRTLLEELSDLVHQADPEQLVTYANYPTAEYLHGDESDFVTFNVFLESRDAFHRYLTKLQHTAAGRPLVLGEMGIDAGTDHAGELRQAETLDWQLETALERGVAGCCVFSWTDEWAVAGDAINEWHFGLTRADRSPRMALDVAERWNGKSVEDLRSEWPSVSVVICAHNAEPTIDECLRHTCALDYPNLEVVVVDDGSSDQTAAISGQHARARLASIPHSGLATARNEGLKSCRGEIVAFLASDAYPSPEWPYFLVLGFDRADVVGVGGPNECPPSDGIPAKEIAAAAGGPIHVLLSDDRAEHVPGCNMAFWRAAVEELGGFDPIYMVAGDDVDFCWRVLDRDWEIGFHPAALVWHHPRTSAGAYLHQQLGYGRSEALVQARHPDRFSMVGSARWRGRIYAAAPRAAWRERIYRGLYGAAPYQSVYRGGGELSDTAHQLGIPLALAGLLLTPLMLTAEPLDAVPVISALFLAVLAVWDFSRVRVPARLSHGRLRFRAKVTFLNLIQPVARAWGRAPNRSVARRSAVAAPPVGGPLTKLGRGDVLLQG